MFTLSAFADEIDADPAVQCDVLGQCDVRFIEFRSIHKTNVLALSDAQLAEFHALIRSRGIGISAIGSPVGKIRIDEPFEPHLEKLKRAIDIAQRFETLNIRIFSYYPAEGATEADWPKYRDEVMRRMEAKAALAEKAGVRLLHENEHRIYGDTPERAADVLNSVASPALAAAYDAANFVYCGTDPLDGWHRTKERTVHFHIKDWKRGEEHGSVCGQGDGQYPTVLAEAAQRGYDGFATLEPHLLGGGPTGGVTGSELFPKAVEALRQVLKSVGAEERRR